jgi:hypothetical protein
MRRIMVLLLVLALVILGVAPFSLVKANPMGISIEEVPPPPTVKLGITIESPQEHTVYTNGTINACFNETLDGPESISMSLYMTTYKGDWMSDELWCPFLVHSTFFKATRFMQFNFSITDIPFGEHTLEITPHVQGQFWKGHNGSAAHFSLEKTVSVKFSVLANPIITMCSPQNANSTSSSFPLNFTVDHAVKEMAYSLDGKETRPLSGNTTLTALPNGQHNITVYATDEFGYKGSSDTLFFNVNAQEFPAMPLILVSITAAVSIVAAAGLLAFQRKHQPNRSKTLQV